MKQVFVRLFGGMGNQLFQYSCARAVALRNNAQLVLDYRQTNAVGAHWAYALDHFNIDAILGTDANLPPAKARKIAYAGWRAFKRAPRFTREKGLGFNPEITTANPNCYLHGYFQSELYFADVAEQIRQDLGLKTPASPENQNWLSRINDCNAVSLHLRRGDYLAGAQTTYASCDANYYAAALKELHARGVSDPTVFVFSDDPTWARNNLKLSQKTEIVDCNDGAHAYEDLRLIAACNHNITANSTFSWWGAWLNNSPRKMVIAPRQWFAKGKPQNPDILPANWIDL